MRLTEEQARAILKKAVQKVGTAVVVHPSVLVRAFDELVEGHTLPSDVSPSDLDKASKLIQKAAAEEPTTSGFSALPRWLLGVAGRMRDDLVTERRLQSAKKHQPGSWTLFDHLKHDD